jgi:hypothetical protein
MSKFFIIAAVDQIHWQRYEGKVKTDVQNMLKDVKVSQNS